MTLHMVSAHTTAATGAGTEDTFAAAGFAPTGESEVQVRSQIGGLPRLIGYSFINGDVATAWSVTSGVYGRIGMNTWTQAQYIKHPPNVHGVATGGPDGSGGACMPICWLSGGGIALDEDADWDCRLMTTTANTHFTTLLFLRYGAAIPWNGWPTTWRLVSAGTDVTANTWSSIGTITDLDPRLSYRVNCICGTTEDQPLVAIRVTSPGNSTYAGAPCNQIVAAAANPPTWIVPLTEDSIIVSGVETVSVQGLCDAATKPSAYIGFQPTGASSATAAAGGVSAAMGGGGGALSLGGLIGGSAVSRSPYAVSGSGLGGLFGGILKR